MMGYVVHQSGRISQGQLFETLEESIEFAAAHGTEDEPMCVSASDGMYFYGYHDGQTWHDEDRG